MTDLVEKELELFVTELMRHLSPQALQQLARETQFVQRQSKFGAKECIKLCVWLRKKMATASLVELCSALEASSGVTI